MTTFKLLVAASILSALIVPSASAQAVIDEPGMYAFYHPDSSLGMGSTRPAVDAKAMARPVRRHPRSGLPVRSAR
jgi:hypothetical protein